MRISILSSKLKKHISFKIVGIILEPQLNLISMFGRFQICLRSTGTVLSKFDSTCSSSTVMWDSFIFYGNMASSTAIYN